MFLKTLTLKGFKSFADPTSLELQPGVTVVVGPNGSGKSNVVDAIAWVLGAQGPRVVRSSKMDDVIFAGTSRRPALGRAEVSLTIDNSAQRLPIEFAEVTITRTLFRTGESEYAINAVPCRLLDVQELLSDTGVGRQQHVIIGQGQLDAVLQARPEERRAIVEEAAGVLKYRRRRERAERRLESSGASLARLEDLVREVRRQIRPLERQAAAARRHAELAGEARSVRLYLVGREIGALERQLEEQATASASAGERRGALSAEAAALDEAVAEQQEGLAALDTAPLDALLARAEQLRERAHGLRARCDERLRSKAELAKVLGASNDLERLAAEQQRVAAELASAEEAAAALAPEWGRLEAGEEAHHTEEQQARRRIAELEAPLALPGSLFAAAEPGGRDAPGGAAAKASEPPSGPPAPALASLADARRRAAAARDRLAGARAAEARLGERATSLRDQHAALLESVAKLRSTLERTRLESARAGEALAEASAAEARADESATEAEAAWHEAGAADQAASARVEALELALAEARARAGLARLADAPGVLGTVPELIEVADGADLALEAALEPVLDAVLVRGSAEARRALAVLRGDAAGGSVLLVTPVAPGATGGRGARTPPGGHPAGTEPLRPLVASSDPGVEASLDALLADVVMCRGGFEQALDAALAAPAWTVVTPEGERFAPSGWRVGAGRSGVTRAALERAREQAGARREAATVAAAARAARVEALAGARGAAAGASREAERLAAQLAQLERSESDASDRLGPLAAQVEHAAGEAEAAAQALEGIAAELAAAEDVLARGEEEARRREEAEREAARRREAAQREAAKLREEADREAALRREIAAAERRSLEERSRALLVLRGDLEVRAAALEERRAMLRLRGQELALELAARRDELDLAEGRRAASEADGEVIARLAAIVDAETSELGGAVRAISAERAQLVGRAAERRTCLAHLVAERQRVESVLAELATRLQRLEIGQAEARGRYEAAVEALGRDLDTTLEEALACPEPDCPAGRSPAEHLVSLDAELRSIGPVNPLAVEELAELEERHAFLQAQLEDVRGARRELNEVIRGVDGEIAGMFSEAYADVAEHFSRLISVLFPGGEGRLHLTAPDDPLTTGVEIEARPPGRNVRRLSLLSGGERSLVALAFLFAVFRSRPSPFYVMDEVEAALDEVNLRRFLGLLDDFRNEAQLIVVSHQKKTMEVADALYGVTMQPGGASRVVSERLRLAGSRDTMPAPAMGGLPTAGSPHSSTAPR